MNIIIWYVLANVTEIQHMVPARDIQQVIRQKIVLSAVLILLLNMAEVTAVLFQWQKIILLVQSYLIIHLYYREITVCMSTNVQKILMPHTSTIATKLLSIEWYSIPVFPIKPVQTAVR